jgi:hypothetical protein
MPIELSRLMDTVQPESTILLFGAGSSLPSGAPSVSTIISHLTKQFSILSSDLSLGEICSLVEDKSSRKQLGSELINH